MREPDDGERATTIGRASDSGQVYQSGADQYVTHIHIAESRGRTAHEARRRADAVVQVLTRTVGELTAHCKELEGQVRRARAEGRAAAQAEFAEKLKDAELRVLRARSTMRQAEEERGRAEALLARAQEELALRRDEVEQGEREAVPLPGRPGPSRDGEPFSDLLERAEAEIGAVRDELRQLGENFDGDTAPRVVQGEWTERTPAETRDLPEPRMYFVWHAPGPPRRPRIGVVAVASALPPWIPMLVVTAIRAAYATDASSWQLASFTAVTVLLGALACVLALFLVTLLANHLMNRASERSPSETAIGCMSIVAIAVFGASFFTPLDWPGPGGGWGRAIVSVTLG
ncbi:MULTISPECIES: hypothetical protein [Streptomyces]|uniref:Uncharacterized protein n=1 Tax=Streptomyces edwardsiae TaxID=3075527 RepID=A0ABU2Q115_9ACTN|nr:hypothetical protein [Streptomyces sp. DSM 41636]MDT0398121.1 hypothetical protein [Streptomyces sp. DSM 41636]